jgi:hypothetical protein
VELKDNWIDQRDDVDMAGADVINQIAHSVIQNEEDIEMLKNQGSGSGGGGAVDTEMSDSSTNAVQNKVIKKYVDNSIQSAILDSWEVAV